MKKPTCTFPKTKYKILKPSDKLKKGDKFNYRYPPYKDFDWWAPIQTSVGGTVRLNFPSPQWIVIRLCPTK